MTLFLNRRLIDEIEIGRRTAGMHESYCRPSMIWRGRLRINILPASKARLYAAFYVILEVVGLGDYEHTMPLLFLGDEIAAYAPSLGSSKLSSIFRLREN